MAIEKRPRTAGGRPRRDEGAVRSEQGAKSKNKLRVVSSVGQNGSSTNMRAASSSRINKATSSGGNVPVNLNAKNALGSRNQSIQVQGLSIALRMAIIFGILIAVMVFVSLMLLNAFMKDNLKEEIKKSGVKASMLLSMTGQVYNKFKEIVDAEPNFPQGTKGELVRYLREISVNPNNHDENLLCISLRDPVDIKTQIFSSYAGIYSESGFMDHPPITTTSGVEIREGIFVRRVEGGQQEIPSFRFEKKIVEKDKVIGYSIIFISFQNVEDSASTITNIAVVVAAFAAIIGLVVSWLFARTLSEPLLRLVKDIRIVADGDLEHKTRARSKDEIGVLALAFNKMTENLRYQQDLEMDAEVRNAELSHAKEIQQRLLPRTIPNIKGFEFHQIYISAKEVGGDYYDVMPVDGSNLALLVADVSGKGIPGSMVMAETRTILRIIRNNVLSSKRIMSAANKYLAEDIKPGMFVTMMYCILNVIDKTMLVSSAGHNPLMIQRATGEFIKVNPKGIALGFDKGPIFDKVIAEQKIQLYPGDRVVLYTDGVVESMNINREEYSEERLEEFVQKNSKLSSKNFVDKLMADVASHQGQAEQHDDITVLTFKVLS